MKLLSLALLASLALITQGASAEECEPRFISPSASVHSCRGLRFARLRGEPKERARALGRLLRSEGALSPEVIRYFSNKVASQAKRELGVFAAPARLLHHQVTRLLHRAAPPPLAEELDAMAHGMGVDPIELRRALSLPDLGVFLQGLGSHPLFSFLPAMGCTSVATPYSGGGFAYGRNLDFAGVGIFDTLPMLLLAEPPPGSRELRHLVIGADGMPFAGVTGVNEALVTFAAHQNYSRDAGLHGVPLMMIGELVLRSARSLAEAEEILRRNRPASLWTFVLTDLKTGEAMAVESSRREFLLRKSSGRVFVQTNHAMHPSSRALENASHAVRMNSEARLERAANLAGEEAAAPAERVARALAYTHDPMGRLDPARDILKPLTIQSVIFHSDPGRSPVLHVSLDPAPAAAGRYLAFDLNMLFAPRDGSPPPFELVDLVRTPPEARDRQLAWARAFALYFDENRPHEASALLEGQHTLSSMLFQAVALYQAGRFAESERLAASAARDPRLAGDPPHLLQGFEHVRLASLVQLGRKEEARASAERLTSEGMAKGEARRLAQLVLSGRSPPSWMLRLRFDFFSGGLLGRNDSIE